MTVHEMQNLNRRTIEYITSLVSPGMSIAELRCLCEEYMLSNGADSFWYWDVGAFIFSGEETVLSISGKEYRTSNRKIEANDIITIDLSPQQGSVWGDYARTIIFEDGAVVHTVSEIKNQEWKSGLLMEDQLHETLRAFAKPDTTFEELYFYINDHIASKGFVNLDFLGNLGHSIAEKKSDRIYIEKGNKTRLKDVNCFTFEPHIKSKRGMYGFKKENIYCFDLGNLIEL